MTKEAPSGFIEKKSETTQELFINITRMHESPTGFNTIYLCLYHEKKHILKALKEPYTQDDFFRTLLRKEFNIGFQLDHPNICRTLGWEDISGLGNCILLEYIDGITLKEFIDQDRLTPAEAYKIITEICQALQYLHSKQITHRDLKPTNILITHNGNNVKLIDFGLADTDDYSIMKEPAGTRYYIAPEVLSGQVAIDLRADIYSLGIIIGEIAEKLRDTHLASISRKCTQQKRERRYASVAELTQALTKKPAKPLLKYGIAAILSLLLFVGTQLWQTNKTNAITVTSLPVYGNYAISDQFRVALMEETLEETIEATSKLQEAFNQEYPLSEMKQSATTAKQWQWLLDTYGESREDPVKDKTGGLHK